MVVLVVGWESERRVIKLCPMDPPFVPCLGALLLPLGVRQVLQGISCTQRFQTKARPRRLKERARLRQALKACIWSRTMALLLIGVLGYPDTSIIWAPVREILTDLSCGVARLATP